MFITQWDKGAWRSTRAGFDGALPKLPISEIEGSGARTAGVSWGDSVARPARLGRYSTVSTRPLGREGRERGLHG